MGGWGLRLRQAGDVSLRRGAFWLAGGAVGLVLEEQDPAKTTKKKVVKEAGFRLPDKIRFLAHAD